MLLSQLQLNFIQQSMIQTFAKERYKDKQRQHNYDSNPQIQTDPSIWNKFFFINRLHMLCTYMSGIKKETLFRYNDNFKQALTSTVILQKYFKRKEGKKPFDIAKQIFKMQKIAFISLFILSIITGAISVVPIYFQSVLVKAVIGTSGDYYSIYVVGCVILLRFFIMNYVLNLSCNIAINVKLHLQNTFMRSIFYLEEDHYAILKGRIKYLDLDLITQAIYYIPYLITSLILIFGAILLTFIYMSPYTLIIIVIYLTIICAIIFIGKLTFENLRVQRRRVAERQRYSRRSMQNLMNIAFERMSDYLYQLMVIQKSLQTKRNIKINLQYILAQTLGQMCIVLSVITFFTLSHNGVVPSANAYYAVLFLLTTISPMRYCVYGFFITLKAYQGFRQIEAKLEKISQISIHDVQFESKQTFTHTFAQNIGDCFEYSYSEQNEEQNKDQMLLRSLQDERLGNYHSSEPAQLKIQDSTIKSEKKHIHRLPTIKDISEQHGKAVMMFCKVDSNITPQKYYLDLIKSKPIGSSATKITSRRFILPDTLRNNICFYSPFDEDNYKRILKLTELTWLQQQLQSKTSLQKDEHIRFSQWQQARIELARALYNNVDFLLINKPMLLEDEQLIMQIIAQRKFNNKVTIIVNNIYQNYYKYADWGLIIDSKTTYFDEIYKLQQSQTNILNKIFGSQNNNNLLSIVPYTLKFQHKDLFAGIKMTAKTQDQEVKQIKKATILELFRLVQGQAEFIIIFTLILPPACKFYMQYLIGQSLNESMLFKYLFFGVLYIILNFLRGLTLTLYTNFGSLTLYEQICRKNRRLNAHQILEHIQKPAVDWDYHQKFIDKNLVMDYEYGQSVTIETVISFVILCTGQPIYIAIAIPMIVVNLYVTNLFARNARKMYVLKLKQTTGVHKVLATAVENCQRISRYQKVFEFNQIFHNNNKTENIYDLNIEWLQTGVRTIAQFILFLFFITFLVIMVLTVKNKTTFTSLVSLGVSLFINLMYINTFSLKAFRQMQISLYSLTICFNLLRAPPNPTSKQVYREQKYFLIKRIDHIQSITYQKVSLKYFKNIYQKINLTINQGDRIVLSGDSNSFKQTVFYLLKNKIFDKDEFHGNLIINGHIQTQFIIEGLFYLHIDPLLPFFGTVYEALKLSDPSLTEQQLEQSLLQFFEIINTQPLFKPETILQDLSLGRKQLFQVFKAIKIQKCKILVIVNGLDHIDFVTRRTITNYLIKKSGINIVIENTNILDFVHLYPRKLLYRDLNVEEVKPNQ